MVLSHFGEYTVPVAGGAHSITGLGFRPKLIFFFSPCVGPLDETRNDAAMFSHGFAADTPTGIKQAAVGGGTGGWFGGQTVATANFSRSYVLNPYEGAGFLQFSVGVLSMDADGFTIDVDPARMPGAVFYFLAYTGDDLSNLDVIDIGQLDTPGIHKVTVGFQPKALYFLYANNGGYFHGQGAATSGSKQWAQFFCLGTDEALGVQRDDACIVHHDASGLVYLLARLVGMDADGFVLEVPNAATSGIQRCALVIGGNLYAAAGVLDKLTGQAPVELSALATATSVITSGDVPPNTEFNGVSLSAATLTRRGSAPLSPDTDVRVDWSGFELAEPLPLGAVITGIYPTATFSRLAEHDTAGLIGEVYVNVDGNLYLAGGGVQVVPTKLVGASLGTSLEVLTGKTAFLRNNSTENSGDGWGDVAHVEALGFEVRYKVLDTIGGDQVVTPGVQPLGILLSTAGNAANASPQLGVSLSVGGTALDSDEQACAWMQTVYKSARVFARRQQKSGAIFTADDLFILSRALVTLNGDGFILHWSLIDERPTQICFLVIGIEPNTPIPGPNPVDNSVPADLFPYDPDGGEPLEERTQYLTSVLDSYADLEQRVALRSMPRTRLTFPVHAVTGIEARTLQSLLWDWGARRFAIPFWPDAVPLTQAVGAGALELAVSTTQYRRFAADHEVAIWRDPLTWERVKVSAVAAQGLTLDGTGTAKAWAADGRTWVIPVYFGALTPDLPLARPNIEAATFTPQFNCLPQPDAAAIWAEQYAGFDVLNIEPQRARDDDFAATHGRSLFTLDSKTGVFIVYDKSGLPTLARNKVQFILDGRAEIEKHRGFIARRKGSAVPFWVPSWANDLKLIVSAPPGAPTLRIEQAFYTARMFPDSSRRRLCIRTHNGTLYFRTVTGAVADDTGETLTLDAPVPAPLDPNTTAVMFLHLCRLSTDESTMLWHTPNVVEASFDITEIPREVTA